MEYITPLLYRNIFNTLSFLYKKSAVEEEFDLFRIKDVLDSFSEGQIFNKQWAVQELNKLIDITHEECIVIGSWYGLFSHMLAESGFKGNIINIELDPICNKIAKMLKIHSNMIFKHADGMEIFNELNYGNKILVCTACEHIDDEELSFTLQQKHENMIVCLQSNNYYEINSHINCKDNLKDFVKSLPLKTIMYSGTKRHKNEYDRFMVIGK
tara:strand:- start:25273 stop:25908 length:636 start_codon:yes stop_codon:yes gene_type:complete